MMKTWGLVFLVSVVFLNGCGVFTPMARSEDRLSQISVGDSKGEVIRKIGDPDVTRGSRKLENGSVLEVAEYYLYSRTAPWEDLGLGVVSATVWWWVPLPYLAKAYWVQFIDNKVDKWGRAGDWQPGVTADVTIRNK